MPRARARLVLAAAVVSLLAAGCYTDPNEQLDQMQASLDLAASLGEITAKASELQFSMDSLRGVVARQDSTIAKLANLAGVAYPR